MLIPNEEFAIRFAGLPLDEYRMKMTPAAFENFVRFVGLIPGSERLDMVRATQESEDER